MMNTMNMPRTIVMSGLVGAMAAGAVSVAEPSGDSTSPVILSMRERATVQDAWLMKRLETVVPMLMQREGIDMWIIIAREYNEDPVIETMLPATWQSARRRTILLFHDPRNGPNDDATVERLAVALAVADDRAELGVVDAAEGLRRPQQDVAHDAVLAVRAPVREERRAALLAADRKLDAHVPKSPVVQVPAWAKTACSSTSQPAAMSPGVAFSASLWLRPPSQGTKIMPTGAMRER